jgi:hypothetical protein
MYIFIYVRIYSLFLQLVVHFTTIIGPAMVEEAEDVIGERRKLDLNNSIIAIITYSSC